MRLKRLGAGYYTTTDRAWVVVRIVAPDTGKVHWYWAASIGRAGGNDWFDTKGDAVAALADWLLDAAPAI